MAVLDYKPEFMGQPAYPTELHKAADKIDLAEVEKLIAAGAHGLHDCDTVEQAHRRQWPATDTRQSRRTRPSACSPTSCARTPRAPSRTLATHAHQSRRA